MIEEAFRELLGFPLGTFPLEDLVDEFIETYGDVPVDSVPDEDVWRMIDRYDTF